MSSSKKLTYRDFAAGVNLLMPRTPYPSPLHTVYVYTVYLFTQGRREWGEFSTREKVCGATVHKAGSKIPTRLSNL
jgi:hypothetical protein